MITGAYINLDMNAFSSLDISISINTSISTNKITSVIDNIDTRISFDKSISIGLTKYYR